MTRIRAGVIGLGVGEEHIAGYESSGCDVVALCDTSPPRLRAVGERHPGMRLTGNDEDVLCDPDIDVVSVATWEDAHYSQVMRALSEGKHVFVEKPICTDERQAQDIRSALQARPHLKLSTNLPLRASPRFQLVRRMACDGDFGRIYYLEGDYDYGRLWKLTDGWRGDLDFYSVVYGGAVHVVDLILWITGERVIEVSAAGNRIATEGTKFSFNDFVVATLRLEGGALAKVSANFGCVHPHFHGLKVFGTKATFINGLQEGVIHHGRDDAPRVERVEAPYPGAGKSDMIPGFIEAIRSGGEPPVTAAEALEAMTVCFAIELAVHSRGSVRVPSLG